MPAIEVNWGAVATALAAVLLLLGTYLTIRSSRQQHGLDHAQRQYDQLQEDLTSAREHIAKLEARIDKLVRRDETREDYIGVLRMHIHTGQPPPPPPYPTELASPA